MIEFCTCGSMMIDGKCSNKKCEHRIRADMMNKTTGKKRGSSAAKTPAARAGKPSKPAKYEDADDVNYFAPSGHSSVIADSDTLSGSAPQKTQKTSRCVTYRMEDLSAEDLENLRIRENSKAVKPGF